jgi:hypothetical protein
MVNEPIKKIIEFYKDKIRALGYDYGINPSMGSFLISAIALIMTVLVIFICFNLIGWRI